jgi:hypothetical protein
MRMINELPAVVVNVISPSLTHPPTAFRFVLRCDIAPNDRLTSLHIISASRKLQALQQDAHRR